MIKRLSLPFAYLSIVFSFTIHDDLIPLYFGGEQLDNPFLGGLNRPRIQWVDHEGDGDLDLFILDASGYLRYLENNGDINNPDFNLVTFSFHDIYCGAWFYFYDFNGDGSVDLMSQNSEDSDYVSYFMNSNENYIYMGKLEFNNTEYVISNSVMTPTFADIDNDGDLDFFTGNMTGTLTYYENLGIEDSVPQFEFITNSWQDIYIVGAMRYDDRHGASALRFIDLDGDGDLDLSWGDYFQQSIYIIWNSGTIDVPIMEEVTNQYPPETPVFTAGQNMPTFADLDGDGDEDLYVTVLSGAYGNQLINNFLFYKNEGTSSNPDYIYQTDNYFNSFDIYSNSSPELIDIDLDGDLDLFVANQYDLSSTPWAGKIHFFRNTGTAIDPMFNEEETSLLQENMGQMLAPEFGDLNGDGKIDMLVGDFNGFIKYYKNISTNSELVFEFIENVGNIDLSGNSVPTLGDLDGDDDLDLLIGQLNGEILFYRNIGTISEYVFQQEVFDEIVLYSKSAPELIDLNNDGDLDLLVGSAYEGIQVYMNWGNIYNPQFTLDNQLSVSNIGLNIRPAGGFLFGSNSYDVIIGLAEGGMYHIQNEVCINIGDINGDDGWNILDIVTLANCVLAVNCIEIENNCSADINGDGGWNVLDIVTLANCVLEQNCNEIN